MNGRDDAILVAAGNILRDVQKQINRLTAAHEALVLQVGAVERKLTKLEELAGPQPAPPRMLHAVNE